MKTFDVERAQRAADEAFTNLFGYEYEHYKGGRYRVVTTTVDEATGNVLVIYYSNSYSYRWSRTLENFTGSVLVEGQTDPQPRFRRL